MLLNREGEGVGVLPDRISDRDRVCSANMCRGVWEKVGGEGEGEEGGSVLLFIAAVHCTVLATSAAVVRCLAPLSAVTSTPTGAGV